jgi:integrase
MTPYRALLMTTYTAGLRVSDVVRLQVRDLESNRMLLRVNHGKGSKDRSTLLSTRLMRERRPYWKIERSWPWFFPSVSGQPTPAQRHSWEDLSPCTAARRDRLGPGYPHVKAAGYRQSAQYLAL